MQFDFQSNYRSVRLPVFARNVVSTSHPLAAQVGLRILQQGGNAVDAAIATAAAMTIVEPVSNAITELKKDGTLAALHKKWLGAEADPGTSTVAVQPIPSAK